MQFNYHIWDPGKKRIYNKNNLSDGDKIKYLKNLMANLKYYYILLAS